MVGRALVHPMSHTLATNNKMAITNSACDKLNSRRPGFLMPPGSVRSMRNPSAAQGSRSAEKHDPLKRMNRGKKGQCCVVFAACSLIIAPAKRFWVHDKSHCSGREVLGRMTVRFRTVLCEIERQHGAAIATPRVRSLWLAMGRECAEALTGATRFAIMHGLDERFPRPCDPARVRTADGQKRSESAPPG